MGVDYTANYGIGVKLIEPDFEKLEPMDGEPIDSMGEYVEYLEYTLEPDGIKIEFFEVGQGNYTGESNDYYLCVRSPMVGGVKALKTKIDLLKNHLRRHDIKYVGEVDLVGGLHIW